MILLIFPNVPCLVPQSSLFQNPIKKPWVFRPAGLCFKCFYQLERSLRWMLDWRQLLRPQHHFLPGEENHYKGQVSDKAGDANVGWVFFGRSFRRGCEGGGHMGANEGTVHTSENLVIATIRIV